MRLKLNGHDVENLLNGFLCVYKPKDISLTALKNRLIKRICEEGNKLDDTFVPSIQVPIVEPHPVTAALLITGMREQLDYSLHPRMIGHLFRPEDIRIEELNEIDSASSGICLFGINEGCDKLESIRNRAWLNEYYLLGEFGREHENSNIRGKLLRKASYEFVTQFHLLKLLSKLQMEYKRLSFEFANKDLESQESFELARKGAPRPQILGTPIIYNLQLKRFQLPKILLNIQVISETDYFLRSLMDQIGYGLETLGCTRALRRVRQGPFNLNHALLDKHYHLISIVKNILMCNRIVEYVMLDNSKIVQKIKTEDLETNSLVDIFQLKNEPEKLEEEEDCLRIPWGREYT